MKSRDKSTEAEKVSSKRPNDSPSTDQPTATAKPRKARQRGKDGRFKARLTHGGRRKKTARGRPVHADEHDRRGQEYARRVFKTRGYDSNSPLKGVLADKKASVLRCDDQLAAIPKMHTRTGDLKEIFRARNQLAKELESLLVTLEQTYVDPQPAKPEAEQVYRAVFFAEDENIKAGRAQLVFDQGDAASKRACEQADRRTASESLKAAGIEATDAAVKTWWLGREWVSPHTEVAHLDGVVPDEPAELAAIDTPPMGDPAPPDTEAPPVEEAPHEPAQPEREAQPIEPERESVAELKQRQVAANKAQAARAAASSNVVPFLGSREHGDFDTGRGRSR